VKRSIGTGVLLAAVVAAVSLVGSAAADSDGGRVIDAAVFGSTPSTPDDPGVLFGVNPGGRPWVVDDGDAEARRDGRIRVRLEGLVIPGVGVGTVQTVTASLFCNGESVGETAPVPLSADGDAEIEDTIAGAPDPCLAPAILVHPNCGQGTYIAATGA
jgi:hypothetical protein